MQQFHEGTYIITYPNSTPSLLLLPVHINRRVCYEPKVGPKPYIIFFISLAGLSDVRYKYVKSFQHNDVSVLYNSVVVLMKACAPLCSLRTMSVKSRECW